MRTSLTLVLTWTCLSTRLIAAQPEESRADDLAPPFAVTVDGVPIDKPPDTTSGVRDDNSYPWVGDFDEDGKPDLLIGQGMHGKSREGHLRIYRNLGGPNRPRLGDPTWFDDQVPTGRIPKG